METSPFRMASACGMFGQSMSLPDGQQLPGFFGVVFQSQVEMQMTDELSVGVPLDDSFESLPKITVALLTTITQSDYVHTDNSSPVVAVIMRYEICFHASSTSVGSMPLPDSAVDVESLPVEYEMFMMEDKNRARFEESMIDAGIPLQPSSLSVAVRLDPPLQTTPVNAGLTIGVSLPAVLLGIVLVVWIMGKCGGKEDPAPPNSVIVQRVDTDIMTSEEEGHLDKLSSDGSAMATDVEYPARKPRALPTS